MFKKKLEGTKTCKRLKEAFAAECFAERRFKLFAAIARDEGLPAIEDAFNEMAISQSLHAESHFKMLQESGEVYYGFKVGNTIENIKTALEAEVLESNECTGLIKSATEEGMKEIAERIEEIAIDELSHIHRLNILKDEIVKLL
ncbi:MAG: rubrerythrin [Bdellovibrio sp.]|nr:rubrerythrin [Bdellovibrio sp.]